MERSISFSVIALPSENYFIFLGDQFGDPFLQVGFSAAAGLAHLIS
jgi:hypothetical protein